VAKITTLTDAQRARFPEWVARYTARGLSCEPADRARAARGFRAQYEAAGLHWHGRVVWVQSPLVMAYAASIASRWLARGAVHDAVNGAVYGAVNGAVHDAVDDAVRDAVYGAVGVAVNGAVSVAVDDAVRDAVYGAVGVAVRDAVDGAVRDAVDGAVGNLWRHYLGGALWISYVAWATYIRDALGVPVPIGPREDTDESCGWWWPHRDFVMACDRPAAIHRDDAGRLHSASGPAILWRDGWGIHAWHGTRVPREWIEAPDAVAPTLALTHPNAEERRCLAEILGWGRVIALVPTRTVDDDGDPAIGTLLECELHGERSRFLRVRCGTGREFVLAVPPDAPTALAANAWTYGLDAGELRAMQVRT